MKNERILSHKMSKQLTIEEIENLSSGGSFNATFSGTYNPHGPDNVQIDATGDC